MSSIRIKTAEQIEGIKKSCKLSFDALNHSEQFIKEGVTTAEIDAEIEVFIRDNGGIPAPLNYHGFPKSTCTSINEVICHGIPNDKDVLKNGDIIKIDVSTILDGYYGDTCKTFAVGTISDEAQNLLDAAKECLNAGIAQVKPDAEFGKIGKAITELASFRGYSVVYQFTGHGTGLALHEEPQVLHDTSHYDTRKMKSGMIFTIEPMINVGVAEAVIDKSNRWAARTADGKLSAQFEHTLLVTDYGVEILTA